MKLQELMDKKKLKRSLEAIVVAGVVLAGGYYAKQGGREDASSREDSTEQYGSRETTYGSRETGGAATTATTGKTAAPSLLELPAASEGEDIIRHDNYTISYNSTACIPNWVAYELTSDELAGDEERGDRMFSKDPSYRKKQAMREDYSGSGWTKGHMAPAADFRWSADAMDETFYLTNVCPQDETLNAGDWEYLERQVRGWAKQLGSVWVVSGPIVGTGRHGRIGERGVVVPDAFFKAVLGRRNGQWRAIAFVMGNDTQRYWLRDCAMSVDCLEKTTGLDFFPTLEDAAEQTAEASFKLSDWGIK